jgi:hypothetical protein
VFEDEHRGPTLPETTSELAYRIHWVGLGILAAAGCGGNAPQTEGAVAALSVIGFALLCANRESYAGAIRVLARRAAFWYLPVSFVVVTLAVGLFFPAYHAVVTGPVREWELLPRPPSWVPVAAQFKVAAMEVMLVVGLYGTAVNALLMCQSRLVFARTWAMLSIAAGALAVLGLAQYAGGADGLLWLISISNPNFFSTFPHPAQWCAFALLWLGTSFGLLAWLVRQRGWRWLTGIGWVFLVVALLLDATIMVAGDPAYRLLALAVSGTGCLVIAWQTRQERLRANRSGPSLQLLVWAAVGLACFGFAAKIAMQYPLDNWIQYAGGTAMHERVLEDTQSMWRARKWLGWGPGSFRVVYSFYQGADQGGLYYSFARSDFWQSLAEHGIIGTVIWWVPAFFAIGRLVWRRRIAAFLIAPAAGLAAIALLSFVDFPFACPAVFFGFWLILFSITRWSEVDQESTASAPSERRRIKNLRASGQTLPPMPKPAPGTSAAS